jgi:hypothetical protein
MIQLNSVTFEEAINLTQSLLEKIETGKVNEQEIQNIVTSLVNSENGARGFFVTYLTDERPFAEQPAQEIILALQTAPEIVSELLVKNLAMSTAMVLTHRRNSNEELARGSEIVQRRTTNLIKLLKLDLIIEKLQKLGESITTGEGNYQAFLRRWDYDREQLHRIQQVLGEIKSGFTLSPLERRFSNPKSLMKNDEKPQRHKGHKGFSKF